MNISKRASANRDRLRITSGKSGAIRPESDYKSSMVVDPSAVVSRSGHLSVDHALTPPGFEVDRVGEPPLTREHATE